VNRISLLRITAVGSAADESTISVPITSNVVGEDGELQHDRLSSVRWTVEREGQIMKLAGTILVVKKEQRVTERFSKREFVLETRDNPRYPQSILFQMTGDKMGQLDSVKEDDEVTVEFEIRGREWRSPSGEIKHFNTLDAFKVEVSKASQRERSNPSPTSTSTSRPPVAGGNGGPDDDIPF
jgi:hypothetical protein